ncbi:MAG: PTS sugar transporter subunit IIA, partial [Erysipelotrichaceae bacterium]|nr:PTS sugar transporter subunit IIA [Erysipelotrichaceae bacterium]
MEIKDILDENIIDLSIEAKNKDQVLRHLANLLKENGYIQNLEEFVSDIYLRESEGITGIGNGIAIPHGKSN